MSRQVAVAIDFSQESEHAFQWALDNFFQQGDWIHLIHCDEDQFYTPVTFDGSVSEVFAKLTAAAKKSASQLLEDMTDKLEERKVRSVCAVSANAISHCCCCCFVFSS